MLDVGGQPELSSKMLRWELGNKAFAQQMLVPRFPITEKKNKSNDIQKKAYCFKYILFP